MTTATRCRAGLAIALLACAASALAKQDSPGRVLIVHSFGPNFAPFDEFASGFKRELARISPAPVEFFEASIETARFGGNRTEAPLAAYLSALFAERGIDLVVSVGGPAAWFCVNHRERLFPETPLLIAGVETRVVPQAPRPAGTVSITVALDLHRVAEHILEILPDTEEIVVVMGGSPLDKLWIPQVERELQPFRERTRVTILHDLPLATIESRIAALPPRTAVLYGFVSIDGDGVPHEHDEALVRLRAVSPAPIFGITDGELGRGIVGGPLLPIGEASLRAAEAAHRLLSGVPTGDVRTEPLTAGAPVYDFRELERFEIPGTRLPPGSTILFRPTSFLARYRVPLLVGLSVMGLEAALIAALLVQRERRQKAEEAASDLSRRLLTAHEDERRRLARELHDDLSQRLARLAIDAAQIERHLAGSTAEELSRSMHKDSVRLSEDVHALSYRLHPSVLDDLGLSEALRTECDLFSRRESIRADLTASDLPAELPPSTAICLFRVAQEALTNVARHARASRVHLSLTRQNSGIQLTVNDDGQGFQPAQQKGRSLGHASMRERIRLVQGRLDIQSAPGRGTTVRAWVPASGALP